MKKLKLIVLFLVGILLLTGCSKNEENLKKKEEEAQKTEEAEKYQKDLSFTEDLARDKDSKLYIYRNDENEKIESAKIIGNFSDSDYWRIFKDAELTDESVKKSENILGDLIVSNSSREIKLSNKKVDGIYKNEETKKIKTQIIESKDNLRDKALSLLISNQMREIETMKNPGDYKTYYTYLVKDFFEDGKLIFLASIKNSNFSFKDGIFKEESGYVLPVELQYVLNEDKNFAFDKKIEAEDGANYGPSLKKMARDDQDTFDAFLDDRSGKDYDKLMEDLFYVAEEKDLDNFTHSLEDIPGYEDDVVYIKEGPNHIPGTVEIAKKKDYEEAKKSVGKVNWSYCEGIVYHEKTGIAVRGVIDYFK